MTKNAPLVDLTSDSTNKEATRKRKLSANPELAALHREKDRLRKKAMRADFTPKSASDKLQKQQLHDKNRRAKTKETKPPCQASEPGKARAADVVRDLHDDIDAVDQVRNSISSYSYLSWFFSFSFFFALYFHIRFPVLTKRTNFFFFAALRYIQGKAATARRIQTD